MRVPRCLRNHFRKEIDSGNCCHRLAPMYGLKMGLQEDIENSPLALPRCPDRGGQGRPAPGSERTPPADVRSERTPAKRTVPKVDNKELFMKSEECNPNVINQKTFKSEETGQEITYIKIKKYNLFTERYVTILRSGSVKMQAFSRDTLCRNP